MLKQFISEIEKATEESPIKTSRLTITYSGCDTPIIGIYANEDWYFDFFEKNGDHGYDFIVYGGEEELTDMLDAYSEEEEYTTLDNIKADPFIVPDMVTKGVYQMLQIKDGILIIDTSCEIEVERIIIRTKKPISEWDADELYQIAEDNRADFTFPNDEGEGELTISE